MTKKYTTLKRTAYLSSGLILITKRCFSPIVMIYKHNIVVSVVIKIKFIPVQPEDFNLHG